MIALSTNAIFIFRNELCSLESNAQFNANSNKGIRLVYFEKFLLILRRNSLVYTVFFLSCVLNRGEPERKN